MSVHAHQASVRANGARFRGDELELPDVVPGVRELQIMCDNARAITSLCDLLGIREEHRADPELHLLEHDDDHFIWDD